MDVQAAGSTATLLAPALAPVVPTQPSSSAPAPSDSSASAVAPLITVAASAGTDHGSSSATNANADGASANGASANGANSAIGPTPGLATLPAGPPDGSKKGGELDRTLAASVAKLYDVQEQNVSVSFQLQQDPNEIVMVFTDKQTGKVIVQFPSETTIALAKLFDKLDGSVVNKKA